MTIPAQDLHQITATTAEGKKLPAERVLPEMLLHRPRQAIEALAHVGHASRQPHTNTGRRRDHPRSAVMTRRSAARLTSLPTRSRLPSGNTTSIVSAPCRALTAGNTPAATPLLARDNLDRAVQHRLKPNLTERSKVNNLGMLPSLKARRCSLDAYADGASNARGFQADAASQSASAHALDSAGKPIDRLPNDCQFLDVAARSSWIPFGRTNRFQPTCAVRGVPRGQARNLCYAAPCPGRHRECQGIVEAMKGRAPCS